MPGTGEEDSVTGTLKHVKSSVAQSGGIVLRLSYISRRRLIPETRVRSPVATYLLTFLNLPVSSLAPDSNSNPVTLPTSEESSWHWASDYLKNYERLFFSHTYKHFPLNPEVLFKMPAPSSALFLSLSLSLSLSFSLQQFTPVMLFS